MVEETALVRELKDSSAAIRSDGVARQLIYDHLTVGETVVLRAWRGGVRVWTGRSWRERDEAFVRAMIYRYLEGAEYVTRRGLVPWEPTRGKVANVMEALKAVTLLAPWVQPPAWLVDDGPDPRDLLVTESGVLDVVSRQLLPHDPRLFVEHALPFAYDLNAPAPSRWLAFVDELWGGDPDSVALLQEVFGYILSSDTNLQKIFLIVGPPRAGKGVIANILTGLVGRQNVSAPTLAGLQAHFGLQDLIGKKLAIVSDARLGAGRNVQALVERLLAISGEDAITAYRKYRTSWTGPLRVRFFITSNELPRLPDASGALAKRFALLVLRRSFFGQENPRLLAELLPELPGVGGMTVWA